jgi:DNA-binding NtrC family response regulator
VPAVDVLIVDDDEAVRHAFSKALERAGFSVTAVENGLAAVAELQQRTYRAIVCDVHMPFLEGRGFYDELLRDYPDLVRRVVFATGWTDEVGLFLRLTGRPVLRKPVDLTELTDTVRRVADQHS